MSVYSVPMDSSVLNSRPFDVHVWSCYPEVDLFVDSIWSLYVQSLSSVVVGHLGRPVKAPKRNQLKVLLLDLYVCWCEDPLRYLGIESNVNKWSKASRYRALHLSKSILQLLKWLVDEGYVHKVKHWHSATDASQNRTARYRASPKLQVLFSAARFGIDDLLPHPNKECIVMKGHVPVDEADDDRSSSPIEYEDTIQTKQMRRELTAYNQLLLQTHIDIGTLDNPVVHRRVNKGKRRGQVNTLTIGQHNKYVRRIFSRESWELHGRFYGGWWQQVDKDIRRNIFINGNPTVEVDFKALHISLINSQLKAPVVYDPYKLDAMVLPDVDLSVARDWTKRLVLCALNAGSRRSAFSAFRSECEKGTPEKRLTDEQLGALLDGFLSKHPLLKDFVCSDQGIRLMNWDGKITSDIINTLTAKNIPVLTVHDSYIVERHHFSALRLAMIEASLKHCQRNLIAEQKGFDVDFSDGRSMNWSIINEWAVNKLPHITPCTAYTARLARYCEKAGVRAVKTNRGRGLMSKTVLALL